MNDPRLAAIAEQIMALASGDLSARGTVSPAGDAIDAIIGGLNMLAEDFADREAARVRAERERASLRKRSRELERSNEALAEFAQVASHDLQEPLRMVASYTQILREHLGDGSDEATRRYIGYAADGAARMQALVEGLLAYSRIGAHAMSLDSTDVTALLQTVLLDQKSALEQADGAVTFAALPTVIADRRQLGRVFQNLIGNAVKYRSTRPLRVEIGARHEEGFWHFSIDDNGIGFESRDAERIFGMFQRLHAPGKYPGTGIGLSICRKIIQAHGGTLWAEGRPEAGATFHFTLPLVPNLEQS